MSLFMRVVPSTAYCDTAYLDCSFLIEYKKIDSEISNAAMKEELQTIYGISRQKI